jgi:hypothetical protein
MTLTRAEKLMCGVALVAAALVAASIRYTFFSNDARAIPIPRSADKFKELKLGPAPPKSEAASVRRHPDRRVIPNHPRGH